MFSILGLLDTQVTTPDAEPRVKDTVVTIAGISVELILRGRTECEENVVFLLLLLF